MENASLARKVGFFAFVGLGLIALLLVNFSRGAAFWKPRFQITIKAEGVGGLKPGAAVMMSGVPVGSVERLNLSANGRHVLIDCDIESRFEIYSDARFEIEQSGFLGDQYVSITPTANVGKILRQGGAVDAVKPFNLQEAVRGAVNLMQRLEGAAVRLDGAVGRVDRGLFSDAVIGNLTNTVINIRRVSERAEQTVQRLETLVATNSPTIQNSLNNVQEFSVRLKSFSSQIDGLMAQLGGVVSNVDSVVIGNRGDIQTAVTNVRDATAQVKALTDDLQSGRGLAGALLKSDTLQAQFQDLVGNFGILSSNLSRNGILWKPRNLIPLTNDLRFHGRSPFR